MSALGGLRTRYVKKIDPPRPLKFKNTGADLMVNKSEVDSVDKVMLLMGTTVNSINNENFDDTLTKNIITLCSKLKTYGSLMDNPLYQSQLDECFVAFREALFRKELPHPARLHLLQIIELRDEKWDTSASDINTYYKSRGADVLTEDVAIISESDSATHFGGASELVKRSGKYPKPVRLPGKNYCKDEIVIKNSDSGKVMGIKGRRVHMIEQLSETIISFQRVQPTAKERLVQITGPDGDNIKYAAYLIDETIRSNTSPITDFTGSNCSLNSVQSEEEHKKNGLLSSKVPLSVDNSDFKDEALYKHKVTVNGYELIITGNNYSYVSTAKNVLDDFFAGCTDSLDSPLGDDSRRQSHRVQFELPNEDDAYINEYAEFVNSPGTDDDVFPSDSTTLQGCVNADYLQTTISNPDNNPIKYKYSIESLKEYSKSPLSVQKPVFSEQITDEFPYILRN